MTAYRRVLVLGGARSGKSHVARMLAEAASSTRIHIATAEPLDDEMRMRIEHHRFERDRLWQNREAPIDLVAAIRAETGPGRVVLVDCLTLWLSNLLLAGRDLDGETERLVQVLGDAAGPLLLVSNEVGGGIVPASRLGREFRDAQGRLNRRTATASDAVGLVTAGCARLIKPAPRLEIDLA